MKGKRQHRRRSSPSKLVGHLWSSEKEARPEASQAALAEHGRMDVKESKLLGPLDDFRLLGHLAGRGDVIVEMNEWIGGPEVPCRIEGIAVAWPKRPGGLDIRYAVTLGGPRPSAEAFVETGSYAGTRGRGLSLVGLTLEIAGRAATEYELCVEALFFGSAPMREQGSRIVLSGATGREPLVGLRIGLQRPASSSHITASDPEIYTELTEGSPSAAVREEHLRSAPQDAPNSKLASVGRFEEENSPEFVAADRIVIFQTSDDDVRECYRLLLDREPEDQRAIAGKLGQPIDDVIVDMLLSEEFQSRNIALLGRLFG